MKIAIFFALVVATASLFLTDDDSKTDKNVVSERPVEVGRVQWTRDLDLAKQKAENSGKPILVLFQEIPGCQTCQDFGNSPLSHPLMVEAIEELFVPVLVYNNKKVDEATLKAFDEPSWNNPIIRYLDANAKDLIARKSEVWSTTETAKRMIAALKSAGQSAPDYLHVVAATDPQASTETAEFAMHCYWEGEAKLGSINGVMSTQSGWRDNLEVVQVEFDPAAVDYDKLLQTAHSFDCASKVFAHTDKQHATASKSVGKDSVKAHGKMRIAKLTDQKYYVRNSIYAHLPLTSLQATKINAALYQKQSPSRWLSPRQNEVLKQVRQATEKDKTALAKFVWPDDDSKLVNYHDRLNAALKADSLSK